MDTDTDVTMAETLRERLGGASTMYFLILRAVGIWHHVQWDLRSDREDGLPDRQRAPVITPE